MSQPFSKERIERRLRQLDHRLRIDYDWAKAAWHVQEVGAQTGKLHHVLWWSGPVEPAEPLLEKLKSIDWAWTNATASGSNIAIINDSMGDPEMANKIQAIARLREAKQEALDWLEHAQGSRATNTPKRHTVDNIRRAMREGRLVRDKIRAPKKKVILT